MVFDTFSHIKFYLNSPCISFISTKIHQKIEIYQTKNSIVRKTIEAILTTFLFKLHILLLQTTLSHTQKSIRKQQKYLLSKIRYVNLLLIVHQTISIKVNVFAQNKSFFLFCFVKKILL